MMYLSCFVLFHCYFILSNLLLLRWSLFLIHDSCSTLSFISITNSHFLFSSHTTTTLLSIYFSHISYSQFTPTNRETRLLFHYWMLSGMSTKFCSFCPISFNFLTYVFVYTVRNVTKIPLFSPNSLIFLNLCVVILFRSPSLH